MTIDRIQRSRHKRDRVLVFLEDGACLRVTEREVLGLRAGDTLDGAALRRLKEAAGISNAKLAAAELVGRRAMSRFELEKKLRDRGASEAEAQQAAAWMEYIGAIGDGDYAALLVRHYSRKGYGPGRLRDKLREKGVPRELWDEALEQAPPAEEQIARFLEGKLRGETPDIRERKRLSDALLRRGFSWGDIKAALARLETEPWEE